MGMSEQPSRPKLFVWLAGFVIVFGAVSWYVTGGTRHQAPPANHSRPSPNTPAPTPPVCQSDQLQLFGAFNECADVASPSFCGVTAGTVDNVFVLHGTKHTFVLDIGVPGGYIGAGDYGLNDGAAEVDIRENISNAFWKSITGVLSVSANNGRSGTVYANLDPWVGNAGVQPYLPLRVQGSWTCS
jgi:hypothetical protein